VSIDVHTPVVTGAGVITPAGVGLDDHWSTCRAGRTGIGPLRKPKAADAHAAESDELVGQVHDFDPADHLPPRLRPQTDRSTKFALVAAQWALSAAGLDLETSSPDAGSVVVATSLGGVDVIERELESLWSRGPKHVTAYMSFAWFYGVNTGQVSIRHGLTGPSGVMVTGDAGGLDALGQARRLLRSGQQFVVCGGTDAPLSPLGFATALPRGTFSVGATCTPEERNAGDPALGEGCAMLVLETLGAARQRGAPTVLGAITGYASSFDPAPDTGRPPSMEHALRLALADAGLGPADIGVVFADGSVNPATDDGFTRALAAVFGPAGVPVTVPQATTGRLQSASGAVNVATAMIALHSREIPPTVGGSAANPDLDLVTRSRITRLEHALVLGRDADGFNAAVVVSSVATPPASTREN
jgi:minimal PKS chain-length factor (CLF/KS beta)